MIKIAPSSVLLVSENSENRLLLRAQLELMGLWGQVAEVDTLKIALELTLNQKPALFVWEITNGSSDYKLFLDSKEQLGQHIIVVGYGESISLFPNERFIEAPYTFDTLQSHIRDTILPQQVSDALSGEKELAPGDQERIYRDLFDRGSDANLLLDYKTHIIIDANQRALEMYGVTREEMIGMNMLELVADIEHLNMWRDTQFLQTSDGKPVFVERLDKRKDGSLMYVTVSGSLFEFAGRMIFQDIIRDETERKLADERKIELRIEKERVQTLRQLISDATHDLMTPLTIIKTSLYIADKTQDEQKRKQKHALISSQVTRLQKMIEDMIIITKIDTLKQEDLITHPTNIHTLIESQTQSFQSILQQYEHTLTTHLPETPVYASVHNEYMQIVMSKLLDNAIQYTDDNGHIDISLDSDDEVIYLSVTDNGIGISQEDQAEIFNRFYRADQHRPSDTGGSGLGLTIAKIIIDLHSGSIEVISEKGKGTTFRILLPKLNIKP